MGAAAAAVDGAKRKRRFAGTLDSWYRLTRAWRGELRRRVGEMETLFQQNCLPLGAEIWGIGVQKGGERRVALRNPRVQPNLGIPSAFTCRSGGTSLGIIKLRK